MRIIVSRGSALEEAIGFARACRVGPFIAVSGTAPLDDRGSTMYVGDAYGQTKICLEKSLKAIEELGGSANNVLRTRIMLKNIDDWKDAAKAHGEIFANIKPACTFVEVKGFIDPQWLVETEVDAVV